MGLSWSEAYRKAIRELMNDRTDDVAMGSASDFPDYKYRVGVIEEACRVARRPSGARVALVRVGADGGGQEHAEDAAPAKAGRHVRRRAGAARHRAVVVVEHGRVHVGAEAKYLLHARRVILLHRLAQQRVSGFGSPL